MSAALSPLYTWEYKGIYSSGIFKTESLDYRVWWFITGLQIHCHQEAASVPSSFEIWHVFVSWRNRTPWKLWVTPEARLDKTCSFCQFLVRFSLWEPSGAMKEAQRSWGCHVERPYPKTAQRVRDTWGAPALPAQAQTQDKEAFKISQPIYHLSVTPWQNLNKNCLAGLSQPQFQGQKSVTITFFSHCFPITCHVPVDTQITEIL